MTSGLQGDAFGSPEDRIAVLDGTLSDFETRLSSRTKVPLERIDQYVAMSEEEAKAEAISSGKILRRFAQAVVDSMDDANNTDDFLRTLDLKSISRDHDWRTIFAAMKEAEGGERGHGQVALIKYLQYLSFRKRLLEFIYAKKAGLEETDELNLDLTSIRAARNGGAGRPANRRGKSFKRLAMGDPVCLELGKGATVELMMGGHLYRLVGVNPPSLIDQNGVMYFLSSGRNMVGRHPESDLVVDPDFRDISRAHMVIEWNGGGRIVITDLSTEGTYLPIDLATKRA